MCGIAGVMVSQGSADGRAARAARAMVRALAHRGPDGEAVDAPADGLALGHTRLAILDLSPAGRQPMASRDGSLWITFNGEVYNFRELRTSLPQPPGGWRSRTDTEVVLQAYAHWGRECLRRLRGMFAFAVWDAARQELFLARDRLGIKPLYYYQGDRTFLFASEVRALLASGLVAPRLDPIALDQYLAYQCVPAPRTLVQGVRVLAPGCWLVVRPTGETEQGWYWDLLAGAAENPLSAALPYQGGGSVSELPREGGGSVLGRALREAVALHLVSDVPVAAFLSGGMDSTAVVALMRETGAAPRTFTVCLDEREYNEAAVARSVAARFGTDHTEVHLRARDLLDQLPDALAAMDQPTGDGINTYVVARAVREAGVKVALSGLGGDELFGGYPSFRRLGRWGEGLRVWGRAPARLRSVTARAVRALGRGSAAARKAAALLESDGTLAAAYPVLRQVLPAERRRALLAERVRRAAAGEPDPYVGLLAVAGAGDGRDLGAQVAFAELRTYTHDLLLRDTDQMSMAHGLEVRVPLLDHVVVEYAMGVPGTAWSPGRAPKALLAEALSGLLPAEVLRRPKQGFALPFDPWMRGPLRRFCEERLARLGERGLLQAGALQELWEDFLARRGGATWSRVWLLVVLDEWLERNGF